MPQEIGKVRLASDEAVSTPIGRVRAYNPENHR